MPEIRKAKKEDARAVWEIRAASILSQCAGHYPPEALQIWTGGQMPQGFHEFVERHFHVAEEGGAVVGTGMINFETGKIDAIFVRPAHMRKGVGRKIMIYLEALARAHGLGSLSLESTLNAAPFYRACGFTGDRIAEYRSPRGISLDCIPMVKLLAPAGAKT